MESYVNRHEKESSVIEIDKDGICIIPKHHKKKRPEFDGFDSLDKLVVSLDGVSEAELSGAIKVQSHMLGNMKQLLLKRKTKIGQLDGASDGDDDDKETNMGIMKRSIGTQTDCCVQNQDTDCKDICQRRVIERISSSEEVFKMNDSLDWLGQEGARIYCNNGVCEITKNKGGKCRTRKYSGGGGSSDGSDPGVGDCMNTYSTFPSILGLGAN